MDLRFLRRCLLRSVSVNPRRSVDALSGKILPSDPLSHALRCLGFVKGITSMKFAVLLPIISIHWRKIPVCKTSAKSIHSPIPEPGIALHAHTPPPAVWESLFQPGISSK